MNFTYPFRFKPYVKGLESSPIDSTAGTIGWHSAIIGVDGEPLGGGTADIKELTQRIAIAESLEKLENLYGLSKEERLSLRTESFPTRCGFAVGFEEAQTTNRAIAEAVERWCWSKWVDEQRKVTEINKPSLSVLAQWAFAQFDEVKFFQHDIIHKIPNFPKDVRFCAVVAIKNGGAFPGSRFCVKSEVPWTHALIEAWRNLQIFESMKNRKRIYPFLSERISFFANNSSAAVSAVNGANLEPWPKPELELLIKLDRKIDSYFITRAICKDYLPWHLGSKERFVY